MEPDPKSIEDYFLNEDLLSNEPSLIYMNKLLPINLFSFKLQYYTLDLTSDDSNIKFNGEMDFENSEIGIGRDAKNQWVLPGNMKTISRFQAKLILEYDKIYLKNLSTTNATAFAINKYNPVEFQNDQKVKIGNNLIQFRFDEANLENLEYAIYINDDEEEKNLTFKKIIWTENNDTKEFYIKNTLFDVEQRENVYPNHAHIAIDGKKLKLYTKENKSTWMFLRPEKNAKGVYSNDKLEIRDTEYLLIGDVECTLKKETKERKSN